MPEITATIKNIVTRFLKPGALPPQLYIFAMIVLAPTLIAAFYYGLLTSDIYISEARYAIRTNAGSPATGLFNSILSGADSGFSASEDTIIVKEHALSRDMLEELEKRLSLRGHYSRNSIDIFSRLDADATTEEFLEYYRKMIGIGIDTGSNITTLRVRAYTPEMAQKIAGTMIEVSEELVNRISDRIVNDSLRFARDEVKEAEARIKQASNAITRFRSSNRSIDPGQETSAVLGIVTELESRLAEARTELIEARGFMRENSPQVKVLKGKVQALMKQAAEERTRLANEESGSVDFTRLIDNYEPLVLEQTLARELYTSALTSLELSRAEAQRQQRYLISFVEPKIPDEATEPDRLYAISVVFVCMCLIYAIGGLIWAAIKDHMRI